MIKNKMGKLICAFTLIVSTSAHARDVTGAVVKYTDLDEKISQACSKYCKGNRRGGYLKRVQVTPAGRGVYRVIVNADLVNKHNTGSLFGIGGGMGWSYTVSVRAYGTLYGSNCNLRVDRIDIINDRLGIGYLAKGEEGKVHAIANCKRFL